MDVRNFQILLEIAVRREGRKLGVLVRVDRERIAARIALPRLLKSTRGTIDEHGASKWRVLALRLILVQLRRIEQHGVGAADGHLAVAVRIESETEPRRKVQQMILGVPVSNHAGVSREQHPWRGIHVNGASNTLIERVQIKMTRMSVGRIGANVGSQRIPPFKVRRDDALNVSWM